ncbi:hypothetical protein [Roseibium aggregatum]|uniref:Uncharacterized protein n=1 Tax=Roseibium aggregatum TaxID=187304 RepID=A0A926P4J1_9HYPH|nr:hypothetical protein [Roseibium aggregatum]MBD1549768.1 hypothetical protein [Roseibium aggregatum]
MLEGEPDDGREVYRLKHEKLADRILKSDKLKMNSKSVDGIRFLTENRIHSERLTVPKSFPHSMDNPLGSVGYFFVLLFIAFGTVRLASPELIYDLGKPLFSYIDTVSVYLTFAKDMNHDYYHQPIYYAPHFIADVAWVSYIDRVNRAYIQNVVKGWPSILGKMLAPIGTFFGVLAAFSPELFVFPIVIVGFMFGLLLVFISLRREFGGQAKAAVHLWGWRSMANVITVLFFSYVVSSTGLLSVDENAPTLLYLQPATSVLSVLWAEALALIWFWGHIYPEQNTRNVWSAELSLYDKGRINGS